LTGVTANSLHPGAVKTDIYRRMPKFLLILWTYTIGFTFKVRGIIIFRIDSFQRKFFLQSAKDGAQTSIHLAVSEDLSGVSGKYFVDCKVSFLLAN